MNKREIQQQLTSLWNEVNALKSTVDGRLPRLLSDVDDLMEEMRHRKRLAVEEEREAKERKLVDEAADLSILVMEDEFPYVRDAGRWVSLKNGSVLDADKAHEGCLMWYPQPEEE